MDKKTRFNLGYLIVALVCIVLIQDAWMRMSTVEPIAYSRFLEYAKQGKIEWIEVSEKEIRGKFKEPIEGKKAFFVTTRVDPELMKELEGLGIEVRGRLESDFWMTVLSWVVPVLLFGAFWLFLFRRMAERMGEGGGLMAIGKSRAKVYVEKNTGVTFDDVAGVDEAKQELKEVVEFLKDPQSYGRLGARMPKGILLVGPPGTGKTLLARAVAGEAGVPFFSISGSEFVELFVGVGAARVRDLFEQARKHAPCIIFIDELDALGRARTSVAGLSGGHDEKEQTLNQLLVEMDGFDPASGIVVLAATNRPEILDPALLRAGRFDRHVVVDRPDKKGRAAILRVHMKKIKVAPDVDVDAIAALTPGFTGADLANLVNEAAIAATRRGAEAVEMQDFTAAVERIVAGLEKKNRLINEKEREVVAHHEMGHALCAAAIPLADPVHKVSIIPRGVGALGYTLQRPTEDRFLMTKEELEAKMTVLLGGRAAERLVFGRISTGAADDLSKATDIARNMVTRYGMVEDLGPVALETEPAGFLNTPDIPLQRRLYSEETAREVDCAVRRLVEEAFERATKILRTNEEVLRESAQTLLEKETLEEKELEPFFERVRLPEELESVFGPGPRLAGTR